MVVLVIIVEEAMVVVLVSSRGDYGDGSGYIEEEPTVVVLVIEVGGVMVVEVLAVEVVIKAPMMDIKDFEVMTAAMMVILVIVVEETMAVVLATSSRGEYDGGDVNSSGSYGSY